MTETLSDNFHFGDDRSVEESGDRYYLEKDVKEAIKIFKENLWNHKSKFEGVKCKTCLPLDYVDDELNNIFGSELT